MVHGYVLKTVIFLSGLSVCFGSCDVSKNIEIEEKVYYSDAVVVGKVEKVIPQDKVYPNEDNVYSVEMIINCVYKNDTPVDKVLTVAGAGSMSDRCYSVKLDMGKTYVLLLKKGQKYYEPLYEQMDGAPSSVDELAGVCDLKRSFPKGVIKENVQDGCPVPYDGPDCYRYTPPSTPEPEKTTTPETAAEDPEVTVISVDAGGNPKKDSVGDGKGGTVVHFLSSTVLLFSIFVLKMLL